MAVLGKDYQAKLKNKNNVLIGVAQVRVGKPSRRAAGTAVIGVPHAVTKSSLSAEGVVVPDAEGEVSPTVAITAGGDYTGPVDGCIILRANGTEIDMFDTLGGKTTSTGLTLTAEAVQGVTLDADFTGATEGDTYVIPVTSGDAQARVQTNIISPYSMFTGSTNSVGGLRSANFTPAIDDVKTLETGFPATVDDRMVTKTSVAVKFEALEYTNSVMKSLKDMMSKIINESEYSAVPVEVVMRTRGGELVTYWVPNANLTSMPDIAPTDDFSSLAWELGGSEMTEDPEASATTNTWLDAQWIYRELDYIH